MSPEGDVFNMDMLQAMQDLTDRYTEVESAVSVASLINRRLDAVDADIQERDYLLPELDELTEQDLVKIREIALADKDLFRVCYRPRVIWHWR
jgi:predicted RND superfamily exporter protein